jgi:hypothetical protein
MNAARDAKIARNDPSHTNTDRRHADDATLTNTWQQQNAQSSAGNACWTARILSMSAEHQILERQDQRLEPQNQCMHKRKRVHDVESEGPKKTGVFGDDRIVVVGIGVGDAAAAGRHSLEPPTVQGLKRHQERTRASHLLRVDELLAPAELTGSDVILHGRDHHGNYGEGL